MSYYSSIVCVAIERKEDITYVVIESYNLINK